MPMPTEATMVRRARKAQERFLEASRALANATITLNHELQCYPSAWPPDVAFPVLDGLRDHVKLARQVYEDLSRRL